MSTDTLVLLAFRSHPLVWETTGGTIHFGWIAFLLLLVLLCFFVAVFYHGD